MAETEPTGAKVIPLKGGKKCPLCGKPEDREFRPFCSKRCADLDLGKWLKEDYRIPSEDEGELNGEFPGEAGED
ncbi:MAG: DNA gyrase inhibitor YacG [Rhodospirillales bacterium]|nr:DNA gyrase inhibitor YacG [Rhodospirillales bacterium]